MIDGELLELDAAALATLTAESDRLHRLIDNVLDFARLERTMRLYDAPPATAEEEYQQRMAELDFHSVLAELCPNPVLGLFCGFLQTLLREMAAKGQSFYRRFAPEKSAA